RLFAKYLTRHIEGQPSIVVQNKDGAGGLVGPNYLGEVGPKDGTMLGYFSSNAWNYVNKPQNWRVDLTIIEFVDYVHRPTIYCMRTDVPPGRKQPTDIAKAQGLVVGGLTVDNPKDLRQRLALDMLGVPYRYVTGYRSSQPARLALQRGEIHMFSESPPSYRAVVVPQLVTPGQAIPVSYDEVIDPPPASKQLEGLAIPSFPQLYPPINGTPPSAPPS